MLHAPISKAFLAWPRAGTRDVLPRICSYQELIGECTQHGRDRALSSGANKRQIRMLFLYSPLGLLPRRILES